jgi:hypothetical protein
MQPYWMDSHFFSQPPRRFRKIHLDFHNSQHIPRIGERFDADEFGDTLLAGNVDAVVVFAKDMHGYFYYPSESGPMHPGLDFDLMGAQIAACRKRDIKVYAYYCVTWDHYLAERHPEWLVWKRDRTTYLPKFNETPGWTAICLMNTDFVQQVLDHTKEFLTKYDLDGPWYDMPFPIGGECFCPKCLAHFHAHGLDPFDLATQRQHKQQLLTDYMKKCHDVAHQINPNYQVDQNNQTSIGLGERIVGLDNVDIEALPTGGWGYLYYPTNVRYARNFGQSVVGMTGRFHRSWADYGGLKHPNQLMSELPSIVAQGAQISIGDQPPPHGRLDPAVYQSIGVGYGYIKSIEPWLQRAAPVTEVAIVVDNLPLTDIGDNLVIGGDGRHEKEGAVYGAVKLLGELQVQFDIIEGGANLGRYRLIVLPDSLVVSPTLASQLNQYLANGGRVIASHRALNGATTQCWNPQLGLTYHGESPYAPAYLLLDHTHYPHLPAYEYALYYGTAQWQTNLPQRATVGEPLFQRSAAHYTSHAQSPFDHASDYAAVVQNDTMAAISFPIFSSYFKSGYWIYRELLRAIIDELLPVRLTKSNAPISSEVLVTYQQQTDQHPARYMVHICNYSPNRRATPHMEYLEDPIPLHDITVTLGIDARISNAYLADDQSPLHVAGQAGAWQLTVPKIRFNAIIVCEV